MSRQHHLASNKTSLEACLQPPAGRRYVRSFLFSRRITAPLARVHLIARTVLVLCLSAAQLRTINTAQPDLLGALSLWVLALLLFVASGIQTRVARLYLLLTLPTLLALFTTWTLLTPIPGRFTLVRQPVYTGFINIGVALWEVLWLAIVIGYYRWRRTIISGMLLATIVTFVATRFIPFPAWTFASVAFFHPLTLLISDRGVMLALTKVVGYSGMILCTIALIVTSRDIELIGALRQLRVPQPLVFFLSTVFRALNLAITDYETIYQAQIARAINARPRGFLRRVRDMGSIAVPMVAMMIRRSSEIGDALLARGYTLGQASADFYETSPWRFIDWAVLALSPGLLYIAIGPHPALTTLLQRWTGL